MKYLNIYIRSKADRILRFIIVVLILSYFNISCQPEERISFYNEDAVLILDFLKNNPEQFSSFLAICEAGEITGALRAFNPYGNRYTLFLPVNEAIDNFIAQNPAYNSLDDLLNDTDFVRSFCRYHLVNSAYRKNDFPLGALKDTTSTGDIISVSYQVNPQTSQSEIYLNNEARIIIADVEAVNGIIHIIDKALSPITFSSFDWLKKNPAFTIITEAFEKTGLSDTMGIFGKSRTGEILRNYYTLMVEPDSIFNKRGIQNFQDLELKFASPNIPLNNPNNKLYQFAAYHILEGNHFLDELNTGVYNTFASFPMSITVGISISLNIGFKTIDTLISSTDTVLLNYIPVNLSLSNNPSKNGPVHIVTELVELYKPNTGIITFQFLDEPLIAEARTVKTTHLFDDPTKMLKIDWSGVKYLYYENGTGESTDASQTDYIYLDGPFVITYEMPKTPSGSYDLIIRAHSKLARKATIQVYLDGNRVGSTINLNRASTGNWINFKAGTIDLTSYDIHTLRIESVVPGQFAWDYVRFQPIE